MRQVSKPRGAKRSIGAFLHRVDDRRVLEYFDRCGAAAAQPGSKISPPSPADMHALCDTARALLADHPGDLHVRALYLDSLLRSSNDNELQQRVNAWKADFERSADPLLMHSMQIAEKGAQAYRLTAAGQNASQLVETLLAKDCDLKTRIARFPELLRYSAMIHPRSALDELGRIPNLFESQITVKVLRVQAEFLMMLGKRDQALQLAAACYRYGQMMGSEGTILTGLIGVALRAIAAVALQEFVNNCCETQQEIDAAWAVLSQLDKHTTDITPELYSMESPLQLFGDAQPNLLEVETRWRASNVRFQLVRMSAAARARLLSSGKLPASGSEFAPLLPDGPPADPFTSDPLKWISEPDAITCYSVGPDQRDDRASIAYDPTNGTMSPGDLIARVPVTPRYPFPQDGIDGIARTGRLPADAEWIAFGPVRRYPGQTVRRDSASANPNLQLWP